MLFTCGSTSESYLIWSAPQGGICNLDFSYNGNEEGCLSKYCQNYDGSNEDSIGIGDKIPECLPMCYYNPSHERIYPCGADIQDEGNTIWIDADTSEGQSLHCTKDPGHNWNVGACAMEYCSNGIDFFGGDAKQNQFCAQTNSGCPGMPPEHSDGHPWGDEVCPKV